MSFHHFKNENLSIQFGFVFGSFLYTCLLLYLLSNHFIQVSAMSSCTELTCQPLNAESTGEDILGNLSRLVCLISNKSTNPIGLKSTSSGRNSNDGNGNEQEEKGEEQQEWQQKG